MTRLPLGRPLGAVYDVSVSLGQNIYTPADILRKDLIENDRPYAGITYLSIGFHNRVYRRMDTLEVHLGVVGPHSYAEDVQKKVHELVDSDNPEGWDHQLKDEPVIGATYEQKRKIISTKNSRGLGCDFSVHFSGGIGNAYTYMSCGPSFRFGLNLPEDFGTCRILPVSCTNAVLDKDSRRFLQRYGLGIYFFISADGQAVLRDIFLDGNTFKDSHHVDKEPFVGDFMMGTTIIAGSFRLSLAQVHRTEMFETQEEDQEYVSLNIAFTY